MPDWAAIQSVLDAVLDLPVDQRAARISDLCGGDTELRKEVERLLHACTAAEADGGFLRDAAEYALPVVADLEGGVGAAADPEELRNRVALALEHRYRLGRVLGSGGMATVYLARDLRHDRDVAVKLMRPGLLAGARAERFLQEVRIVAGLAHPHILPLHDSGVAAGLLYHVSAYVEGESLRARLQREGALRVRDALRILRDVASALDYAHRRGIVHRDIKPENVLLQHGHAIVADFGIARAFGRALHETTGPEAMSLVTGDGIRLGTPAYMAPEQAAGSKSVDHRVDLYALGLIAHEMLGGAHPFSGNTPEELIAAQFTCHPLRLDSPDVPPALSDLVQRLVSKHPDDRIQTAEQVLVELERISGGQTPSGPATLITLAEAPRAEAAPAAHTHVGHLTKTRRVFAATPAVWLAGVLLLLGTLILAPWGRQASLAVPLSDRTVAVAAFGGSERASNEAVDRVLQLAADWITQGLTQTGLVTVVPVSGFVATGKSGPAGFDLALLETARAAGAGLLLLPVYHEVDDTVFLSARVVRVSDGVVLRWVGPVNAPAGATLAGVEALRQRTVAALATLVDERLAHWSSAASQPTSFEAYQSFASGLEAFFDRSQARDPHPLFMRAHELDTTFTAPLLWALFRAPGEQADSLEDYLQARRGRLQPWDVGVLDFHTRQSQEEGYQAFRRVVEVAPQSEWLYMLAWTALATNRPAVAVRALEWLDPKRGWMRYWPSYWYVRTRAYHYLALYDRELESARQGRAQFPNDLQISAAEARALVALGRTAELTNVLDGLSYNAGAGSIAVSPGVFGNVVLELRRHSQGALADRFASRLLKELDALPPGEEKEIAAEERMDLLFTNNRWDEAGVMIENLSAAQPDNDALVFLRARLAAARGDREAAQRLLSKGRDLALEWAKRRGGGYDGFRRQSVERRYSFNQAAVSALLGEKDRAVAILKAAGVDQWSPDAVHVWDGMDALIDYPPFLTLTGQHYDDPNVLPVSIAATAGTTQRQTRGGGSKP